MSDATVQAPAQDLVNIEVNGQPVQARKGQMLIQATDASGHYVPRFCYHEKLPIAANCRMCLVEVEKAPKPLPACATPVAEGMKIFTKSPKAIAAQKAVMEFLLINHPLDCPICDQGGECELQDLAMGFGRDISRYAERKRVVKDKDLGPLVSTDMTRCIHCTRCVRFTSEIQGFQELGTCGRGEHVEIGTFIEKSVEHELSGNIIDLCPVGALNNKPYRYSARAWEMTQQPLVSPHDSVGTNLYAHVLRGRVMRVVPRANEDINETWIADRDRYSYEGLYSDDRLSKPLLREGNDWREVDWETALNRAAETLSALVRQHGGSQLGALVAPTATLEEAYLTQRIARALGSSNIDHRLLRADFSDQEFDPPFPWLGGSIAELEQASSVLLIGSNLRKEAPLLAHRIRKAAVKRGAQVAFINAHTYQYLFPVSAYLASNGLGMSEHLAAVVAAAVQTSGATVPRTVSALVAQAQGQVNDTHRALAAQLSSGERRLILLGALAQRDGAFAQLRALAAALAQMTGAQLGYIADGGNTVAAHLAGAVPHRGVGGQSLNVSGLNVIDMLAARLKAYVLVGSIEAQDLPADAVANLRAADCVIALSSYASARDYADIILPIGTFAETSGSYVNLEGRWQSVPGAARPVGESRPAWKVLRVLGNLLNLPAFDYLSSEQVRDELQAKLGVVTPDNAYANGAALSRNSIVAAREIAIYGGDAIVRRATALQLTHDAQADRQAATGNQT
ncbi:MAG: NADH-quinone oxidoreductase subunit NuoG [Steroidobacteraceae bacterium]